MTETISREQYMKAYNDAPEIVRAVYDSDLTVQIIAGLQARYKLHVDNAGLLGQGVGYMLLGLVNPQEFLNELITAKVPEKDAREIMVEINQKIFVPLREQIRSGGVNAQQPATQVEPQSAVPMPPRPINAGVPSYAPPLQSPSYFHLQNKLSSPSFVQRPATPPRPIQPSIPARSPASTIAPLPPKVAMPRPSPGATGGAARQMDSSKMLEDHEEPHIEVLRTPNATAETPLRQALRTVLPPPNLPGAMPESDIMPPSSAPKVPLASSSTDPYREPVE